MRKSKFTRELMTGVPQAGQGRDGRGADLLQGRVLGRDDYKRRVKFGGIEASDARRLRDLEEQNAQLKKLLAEAHLDLHAVKSVLRVKRRLHSSSARRSGRKRPLRVDTHKT